MHLRASITAADPTVMAPAGQARAHAPQPVHLSTSTDTRRRSFVLCELADLPGKDKTVGAVAGKRVDRGSSIP
jgi:hypothetical protein